MKSFLGKCSFLLVIILSMVVSGRTYAQIDSVNCYSSAAGGPYDSTDIGRFVIGTDTFGSVYSHLANSSATNSYVFNSADTIMLTIGSTYHLQEASIMNTLNDANARLSVFIDYNADRAYEASELVWTGYEIAFSKYILDTNITIPTNAVTGFPVMMRVILNNDTTTPFDPACGYYTSGETEDFILMFKFPTTSVKNVANNEIVSFYPNPSQGRFRVNMSSGNEVKELQVRVGTVTGQTIFSNSYSNTGKQFATDIDLSSAAKGIYFVETNVDGQKQVSKIVIQ